MPEGPEDREHLEWYFRYWAIFLAIFLTGPLGLFLLWLRPGTSIYIKAGLSLVVLLLTIWMTKTTVEYYQQMAAHIEDVSRSLNY
jgi:hypothetical protein